MLGALESARKRRCTGTAHALPPGVESLDWLAERPGVREALGVFARDRKWIDDQHLEVCRIPAPTFLEERRAEWIALQLRTLGWEVRCDRAGNVVAQLPGAPKSGPVVALTAHLDTVLAPRQPEEIRWESKSKLLGPGVADNGAGLAALLAMARAIAANPASGLPFERLALVANVGEEGEGNLSGMKFLCGKPPLASRLGAVVVIDGPHAGHITADALACRRLEIAVTGPGGHSWSDRGTANPIHALARAITWFEDGRAESGRGNESSSYNFGVIEGGTTVNSIPASARVKVDLRAEDAAELGELAAELEEALEKALLAENERASSGRVSGRSRQTGTRPGGRLAEDAAILSYLLAVDAWMGNRPYFDCASTDANVPLSLGIPALSIGGGGTGGGAHTPGEWYDAQGREKGLRRIYLLVTLLVAGLGGGSR